MLTHTRFVVVFLIAASWASLQEPSPVSLEEKYRRAMSLLAGGNSDQTDQDDAFNLLDSAAHRGYRPAQTALGTIFERGLMGTTDVDQAIRWYKDAANQGDWIAQFSLGRLYFNGQLIARDAEEAKRWLAQAAASGSSGSAFYLGVLNDENQGTSTDYPAAARWYRQAAEAGNPFAQERLAVLILKGVSGGQSRDEAYAWLILAAELGNQRATGRLQPMESEIGKTGADMARRRALGIRDRIFARRAPECSGWDGQYSEAPTAPTLPLQLPCEAMRRETVN